MEKVEDRQDHIIEKVKEKGLKVKIIVLRE